MKSFDYKGPIDYATIMSSWTGQITKRQREAEPQSIVVKKVKRATRPKTSRKIDLKFIDNGQNFTSIPTAAGTVCTLINGIAQGDDFTNRQGRRVALKSVEWQVWVKPLASTANGAAIVTFWIFIDKQVNGAAPLASDLLASGAATDYHNVSNEHRFKILGRKSFSMNDYADITATKLIASDNANQYIKGYKKLNMEQRFIGTGATVASITEGGVFFLLLADTPSVWTAAVNCRVRFTE